MPEPEPLQPCNRFAVGARGDGTIVCLLPPSRMSKPDALEFAAWIVAIADDSEEHSDFQRWLEAVEST